MRKGLTLGLCVFLAFSSYQAGAQTSESGKISPTLVKVKEYLRAKQADKAVALLQEELKKQPGNAQYLYALGYTYEINREPQKALEAFKQAYRLNPEFPGLSVRIRNLEASLESAQAPAVDESTLTEEQKKARSLFREALKEKGLGNFEKAFALFVDCVELDIGYLGGNDEGIIVTALNHYESKLEAGKDPSATVHYHIYRFFRGDRDIAEKELSAFLASKPAPELAAVAEKWLGIIRNQQSTEKDLIISYLAEKKRKLVEQEDQKVKKPVQATQTPAASDTSRVSAPPSNVAKEPSVTFSATRNVRLPGPATPSDEFSKDPRFVRALASIENPDPLVAMRAAYDLGTFRKATPESLDALTSALHATDTRVKLMAIEALRKIGPASDPALPRIVSWMDGGDPWMKVQGMACIGKVLTRPEVTVPVISKFLGNPNRNVKLTARRLLLQYGHAALPILEEILSNADSPSKKDIEEIVMTIKGGK